MVLGDLGRVTHVHLELGLVVDDLHSSAAEHIARPYQDGIADVLGEVPDIFERETRARFWLRYVQGIHQAGEPLPVLSKVDRIRGGPEDRRLTPLERPLEAHGQVDGRLPAELQHDPVSVLPFHDVQDIFRGDRFEVEPGRDIEIGRDRLWIVVYDDRVDPFLLEGERCVDAAVIELDPLSDPDRTPTDYHYLLIVRWSDLALELVGGVEVRRLSLELGGTRVDHLVGRPDAQRFPRFPDIIWVFSGNARYVFVSEANLLGGFEHLRSFQVLELSLDLGDPLELRNEELVPAGELAHVVNRHPTAERFEDDEQADIGGLPKKAFELLVAPAVSFEADLVDLKRTGRLE